MYAIRSYYGTSGKIVDDMPHRDPLYKDLVFLEKHYKGVMPLEISIDTRKKRGVMRADNLARITSYNVCYTKLLRIA